MTPSRDLVFVDDTLPGSNYDESRVKCILDLFFYVLVLA